VAAATKCIPLLLLFVCCCASRLLDEFKVSLSLILSRFSNSFLIKLVPLKTFLRLGIGASAFEGKRETCTVARVTTAFKKKPIWLVAISLPQLLFVSLRGFSVQIPFFFIVYFRYGLFSSSLI